MRLALGWDTPDPVKLALYDAKVIPMVPFEISNPVLEPVPTVLLTMEADTGLFVGRSTRSISFDDGVIPVIDSVVLPN